MDEKGQCCEKAVGLALFTMRMSCISRDCVEFFETPIWLILRSKINQISVLKNILCPLAAYTAKGLVRQPLRNFLSPPAGGERLFTQPGSMLSKIFQPLWQGTHPFAGS